MVKVAILHEGNSKKTNDNELLKLLLKELNLDIQRVEFFGFGAKNNFFKFDSVGYEVLTKEVVNKNISKILFVVDADYPVNDNTYGGYDNTQRELKEVIKRLYIEEITDIYITCDPKDKCGYLESLILSSIPTEQKECIENFLFCSDFKSKENHKAILNQIYKNAYPNAPFDFSHENFNDLKTKLKNLFKDEQT